MGEIAQDKILVHLFCLSECKCYYVFGPTIEEKNIKECIDSLGNKTNDYIVVYIDTNKSDYEEGKYTLFSMTIEDGNIVCNIINNVIQIKNYKGYRVMDINSKRIIE